MIKVLSIFTKDELYQEDFKKILGGINRKTRKYEYRIKTKVFELDNENNLFEQVLKYNSNDFKDILKICLNRKKEFQEKKCLNRFQKNIIYFYNWFSFFIENQEEKLDNFISFLLEKVYLLPIELRGKTKDEASEKALIIFETINNRGMNLEDADIFKAKLYKRAENINEEKIFIDLWRDFKYSCENLKIEIDDVFRYYSHIIRGREGITSNEINLREFFTIKKYSPFNLKKYKDIMNDLNNIIDVLEFINQEKQQESELAKWIQLIEAYSNQYPKIVLVVYFFINGYNKKRKLNNFLEAIVRYSYYNGSTTRIKFEIYSIIRKICNFKPIDNYYQDTVINDFNSLGRLNYGYALLSFYCDRKESLSKFYIDKIVNLKDKNRLNWHEKDLNTFVGSLGNLIVLDIPKRNKSILDKVKYYEKSKLLTSLEKKQLLSIEYSYFKERDIKQKEKLVKFFKGEKSITSPKP